MIKTMMNVNTLGPIALVKGFLPQFYKQKNGAQIVNIVSISGLVGVPVRTMYCASKFALDGFGKALQGEVQDKNISILQVYPAYVKTNISKNALKGTGNSFGLRDTNHQKGIPVEDACEDIIKAIYLKRYWITIGSFKYVIGPKFIYLN